MTTVTATIVHAHTLFRDDIATHFEDGNTIKIDQIDPNGNAIDMDGFVHSWGTYRVDMQTVRPEFGRGRYGCIYYHGLFDDGLRAIVDIHFKRMTATDLREAAHFSNQLAEQIEPGPSASIGASPEMNAATSLAIRLHNKHYSEDREWKVGNDLLKVIDQIDQMTAPLLKAITTVTADSITTRDEHGIARLQLGNPLTKLEDEKIVMLSQERYDALKDVKSDLAGVMHDLRNVAINLTDRFFDGNEPAKSILEADATALFAKINDMIGKIPVIPPAPDCAPWTERLSRLEQRTPIESETARLKLAIENIGGHPLLTDALSLVDRAMRTLGKWHDDGEPGASMEKHIKPAPYIEPNAVELPLAPTPRANVTDWKEINLVFEPITKMGPTLAFVEAETLDGKNINVGTWSDRDHYKVLRLTIHKSDANRAGGAATVNPFLNLIGKTAIVRQGGFMENHTFKVRDASKTYLVDKDGRSWPREYCEIVTPGAAAGPNYTPPAPPVFNLSDDGALTFSKPMRDMLDKHIWQLIEEAKRNNGHHNRL